jgi:hypothetical protein
LKETAAGFRAIISTTFYHRFRIWISCISIESLFSLFILWVQILNKIWMTIRLTQCLLFIFLFFYFYQIHFLQFLCKLKIVLFFILEFNVIVLILKYLVVHKYV